MSDGFVKNPYAVLPLFYHQTTEDTEKFMDLRRLNIKSDFHLCALFSENSVLSLFLKALRAQRKTLCSLWFAVFLAYEFFTKPFNFKDLNS